MTVELPAATEAGGFGCALVLSVIVAPDATSNAASSSLSMRFAAATSRVWQDAFVLSLSSFCRATIVDTAS